MSDNNQEKSNIKNDIIDNENNKEKSKKEEYKFNNFKILDTLDIKQIFKLLESESTQLKALIMSFLPVHRSKMILAKMDEKEKKEILDRISKIHTINLDVVSKIEETFEYDIKNRISKLLTISGDELSKGLKTEIEEAKVGRVIEIEKKYIINSFSMFEILINLNEIMGYKLENRNEKQRKYIYFDTKDKFLYKNNITYSVRNRDKDYFFTLKLPRKNSIFERDEYNASVSKNENVFDIDIHKNNSKIIPVKMINKLINNKELIISSKFIVDTIRYNINLDKEHYIEISFDKITIENNNKSIELYEVEIENKTAENFVFLNFCEQFKNNTGLKPLGYSKYQRVINELNPNKN